MHLLCNQGMNWPHVSCEVDKKGNIVFEVTSHKGDTDEVTRFIVLCRFKESSFIAICHIWIFVGNIAAFHLGIIQEQEIFDKTQLKVKVRILKILKLSKYPPHPAFQFKTTK